MTSYSYAQPRSSLITCYPNLNYCVLYFNQVIMSKALKGMIKEYLGPNKKKIILEGIKLFPLDIKRERLSLKMTMLI